MKARGILEGELYARLCNGDLVARGHPEAIPISGDRQSIDAERWDTLRFKDTRTTPSSLTDTVEMDGLTIYSVRIFLPGDEATTAREPVAPAAAAERAAEVNRAPKGKPGRKAKWDWASATREMMRLADSLDGLPVTQAAIEEHIADWFAGRNKGNHPSKSAIRRFVVENLPPNYRK